MTRFTSKVCTMTLVLFVALIGCKRDGNDPKNPKGNGENSQTEAKDLLIEEVYYFGNYHIGRTENEIKANKPAGWKEGSEPRYNKYIKITNPTKKELSLDGMGLALTLYTPDNNPEFSKAIPATVYNDSLAISKLYLFPKGNSKNTLKPGESRIIATSAINPVEKEKKYAEEWEQKELDFRALLDLTKADYELNNDNPQVPDLEPFFDLTSFIEGDYDPDYFSAFDISRSTGIALVRLATTSEEMMKEIKAIAPSDKTVDKKGKYTRPVAYNKAHSDYSEYAWAVFIPNKWITDFVVICAKDNRKWVINAKLDKGCNSISQRVADEKNPDFNIWGKHEGKAICRKNDGKKLVDTNDSGLDFEVKKASMVK